MDFRIEKIDLNNYSLFDDMVFWRANRFERESSQMPVSEQMKKQILKRYTNLSEDTPPKQNRLYSTFSDRDAMKRILSEERTA